MDVHFRLLRVLLMLCCVAGSISAAEALDVMVHQGEADDVDNTDEEEDQAAEEWSEGEAHDAYD